MPPIEALIDGFVLPFQSPCTATMSALPALAIVCECETLVVPEVTVFWVPSALNATAIIV